MSESPQSQQSSIQKTTPQHKQKYKQAPPLKPIITYYYIRGLCQPIRHLLYYLNIDFEDRRLDRNAIESLQLDKLQSTFNAGLPAYKDQQISISDSVAICIHICNKYGDKCNNLAGKDIKTKAKINEVLFKYWMEKKKIIPQIVEIIRKTTGYHEAQKGALIRQEVFKLTTQTRFLNYCLKQHNLHSTWVLKELTLIDFYFYETCFYINGFFASYIEGDQNLEGYISFAHLFQALEFMKRTYESQKNTKLFFPFKNQMLREVVNMSWQGDDQQQII